ncbi:MAG: DUF6653 family protein [Rhizobiaceae bacterium]
MDIGKLSERIMGMDDASWARHSNPISGWSRVSILPLFALAVWARVWLGWHALWFIALVLVWTWLNPRLFMPPQSNDAWMTQGVLGERIWLAREQHPLPQHHVRVTKMLNVVSGVGILILAIGLWRFDLGLTIAGLVTSMGAKLWFLDRMVWIRSEHRSIAKSVD